LSEKLAYWHPKKARAEGLQHPASGELVVGTGHKE